MYIYSRFPAPSNCALCAEMSATDFEKSFKVIIMLLEMKMYIPFPSYRVHAMNRKIVLCKITTKMSVKINTDVCALCVYTHTRTTTRIEISKQRTLLINRSISSYNLITKLALIVYVNCCSASIYHYAIVFFFHFVPMFQGL